MNVTVQCEDFLRILSRTQGVVDRRHSIALLTNLLIEAKKDEISVIASDLEVTLEQSCPASVTEAGTVAVSARKLFEIVRESDSEDIAAKSDKNQWLHVSYGSSNFKLAGVDPSDHPAATEGSSSAEVSKMELDVSDLSEMIAKTVFAVSHDDTRSNLAGVHLGPGDADGVVRMVATDGHRLAMIDRKVEGASLKEGVILPRKGLAELAKLLGEETGKVGISVTDSEAVVSLSNCRLSMRLVDGTFPDYEQVVPKETPNIVALERDALLHTVRRVSLLSSERARGVKLNLSEGSLELSANNPDLGEAKETLQVDYAGEAIEIGFNASYLLDVLAVLPEKSSVELGLADHLSPGSLRGEDPCYTYVVMPMRI